MGREVRSVPQGWEHPKNDAGRSIPLLPDFPYSEDEVHEGLADGWLTDNPPHYGCDLMPQWPEEKKTHYQMYETCSEGTPISPVMGTPEALAKWLADNSASAFAGMTASEEDWLSTIKRGSSVSAASIGGEIISGVELEGREGKAQGEEFEV